jgi:anti-sigma regulatory factor (Ser/Thr protein kinase)
VFAAPDGMSATMSYGEPADLGAVRAFVRTRALALGLSAGRADLLLLAVSELTTNTLQHTTGGGRVRVWADAGHIICDVIDGGATRTFGGAMPPAEAVRGRGLAIVEQVCDDVSVAVGPDGTLVRLRLHR